MLQMLSSEQTWASFGSLLEQLLQACNICKVCITRNRKAVQAEQCPSAWHPCCG